MTGVVIIYFSMYGHVAKLASSLKAGVTAVPRVKASVYHVEETLNEDLLKALHGRAQGSRWHSAGLPHALRHAAGAACGGLWAGCGVLFSSSRVDLNRDISTSNARGEVHIAESREALTPRRRRRLWSNAAKSACSEMLTCSVGEKVSISQQADLIFDMAANNGSRELGTALQAEALCQESIAVCCMG
ncbi:hypothetical protein PF011_g5770 [Phytophthora fragariae]|uniref:Flavodoxin-like domain-containing protein n=1 Tax=Phytophthora fragariae TaxID=53985 RepID=A0A6A3LN34_9STRA|nr:hypothetical protein PF011_g5770 [Phytophthora fragariae]